MKVVFFHRKPRQNYNFSVENLFQHVRNELPEEIEPIVKVLSFHSEGFFNRLFICLEAAFNQGEVNHVTGDINFVTIFLTKRRTLLTILDVGFMSNPNPIARFILKLFWIVLPVKRAGVVTTISNSTKTELLKYVSVDPSRIKVVYVPILPNFVPAPKPFNKSKPVILQIGTLPNKNVVRLVKALKDINCHLEVVGNVTEDVSAELCQSKVEFSISMNLSNQEMVKKYYDADIVVLASSYEGFGMPIVEANAVGRAVVTSNILSMPEVAADAAHLVDPFDVESIRKGIVKVIEDDSYREQLIANGYKNSRRFEVKQIALQYAELYRQVIR